MNLKLKRPIIFFDLETTGVDTAHDRIVEISMVKVDPDGTKQVKTRRINPEMPIPAEATAVHGISDEDVKDEPTFMNVGSSFTSSSLMPCTAVASAGMGISGFMRRVLTCFVPSGSTFTIEISTMRSCAVSTPVVSRSKNIMGRLSFRFISVGV